MSAPGPSDGGDPRYTPEIERVDLDWHRDHDLRQWRGAGLSDDPLALARRRRIAILCPGPSLARTWVGGRDHDEVLAVNRAVGLVDRRAWWVFGDPDQFGRTLFHPGTLVFTPDRNIAWLRRSRPRDELAPGGMFVPWEGCGFSDVPRDASETLVHQGRVLVRGCYSLVAALFLARFLRAGAIDLYGCDWAGREDFDGVIASPARSDARWETERRIVTTLMARLEREGIACRRVGATG
jgi:hypothetical protein